MGERGLELRPNPRNGLSFTSYRGGVGASVQLDGVPQVRGGEGMQGRSGLEAGPLASSLCVWSVNDRSGFQCLQLITSSPLQRLCNAPATPLQCFFHVSAIPLHVLCAAMFCFLPDAVVLHSAILLLPRSHCPRGRRVLHHCHTQRLCFHNAVQVE